MADCLSADDLAAYLRGRGDARAVESHVLDCPGCAMDLLLAREALRELRPARPGTARLRQPYFSNRLKSRVAVAAAALFMAVLAALALRKPEPAPVAVRPTAPAPRPVLPPPEPKPLPAPPTAPLPAPAPAPVPEPPRPAPPAPAPAPALPVVPAPLPPKPAPPTPPKPTPAPTVERPVVARVTHALGGAAGRRVFAGETVTTAKSEFLALAVEGLGQVWLREGSRAEFAGAELTLHEGGLIAKADVPATLRTPAAAFEIPPTIVDLQSTKATSELSLLSGKASAGGVAGEGPVLFSVKAGRPAELKPLEAGFAAWLPDKLATRRFSGWFEAETLKPAGFRAMEFEAASHGQAMVQVEERAALALKTALPARGRHVLWVRARQYAAKPIVVGLGVNGANPAPVRLDGEEGKPWRWIGPIPFTADRLDLVVAALSPHFHRPGDERRSFPVAIDVAFVSSDPKATPPEKLPEEPHPYLLVIE